MNFTIGLLIFATAVFLLLDNKMFLATGVLVGTLFVAKEIINAYKE